MCPWCPQNITPLNLPLITSSLPQKQGLACNPHHMLQPCGSVFTSLPRNEGEVSCCQECAAVQQYRRGKCNLLQFGALVVSSCLVLLTYLLTCIFINEYNSSSSSSSSLLALQPCVGICLLHRFVTIDFLGVGALDPRPTPNLKDQGLHFVWPISLDSSGMSGPTRNLRSRQRSSLGHWGAQTASSR
jgi:hypothetical protein